MSTFYRRPIIGADDNSWGNYVLQLMDDSRGANSCRLYNDAGDLKISAGGIGIDDGTVIGKSDITSATIDMSGVSNGNWAKIEMSVSGTAVTIAAADISGATTELIIPAAVKAAYVDSKRGYYLTTTKRLIGIAWKTAAGDLGIIYNTENGVLGFKETIIKSTVDSGGVCSDTYSRQFRIELGDWNMDADVSLSIPHNTDVTKIISYFAIIRNDADSTKVQVSGQGRYYDGSYHETLDLYFLIADGTYIYLQRKSGGVFDSNNYDSTSYNRGWLLLELEV